MSLSPTAATTPEQGWLAWDRFVAATPASGFMQSSWWASYREHAGFGHFASILRAAGAVVGGALVLTYEYEPGHAFYYVPEGPVVPPSEDAPEVFAAVLDSIAESRSHSTSFISHLRIEPRWEVLPAFVRGFRTVDGRADVYTEPRHTLCVGLQAPDAAILAQMRPKGRYNIGVARRHGVTVVQDTTAAGCEDFWRLYEATTDRHHISAKPQSYFVELLDAVRDPWHGALFFAEHEGARLATALVIFFGDRATYFYGGSLDERRQVMAPYLLHFEIMRAARSLGYAWYDFWGVAPETEPDHPWQQISTFKRRFGGRAIGLVPTLDLVYDEPAYARYLIARGR